MCRRGHRQVEHTADLAFELWAETEEALLLEGALAVVEVLTEREPISTDARRTIHVTAIDAEDRLVQWLNEIITLAVIEGFLVSEARITLGGSGDLRAELSGEESGWAKMKTELKSATYHALRIEREEHRLRAVVVIDV